MNLKDFDNYLKNYDDYEYGNLEDLTQAYNFKDINDTIASFDQIKTTFSTPTYLWEIPSFLYSKKISFTKHPRFNSTFSHKHKFIEMSYVYSGEINEVVNGLPITLRKGDLIILDTNVIHSIDITGFNDIMFNFPIKPEYFNNSILNQLNSDNIMTNFLIHALYESHKYNTYLLFHTGEDEFIHRIICKIAQEFIEPSLNSDVIIDSCIIILFSELLRIYDSQEKNQENSDLCKQTKLSIDMINYISSNYETITLASAAKHFHFTPNYFSNIVKKYTGKNFKDLILDEKLKKACFLLRSTNLPIEYIIEKIGISNMQFFYKKFKEQYGVTPYKYRK